MFASRFRTPGLIGRESSCVPSSALAYCCFCRLVVEPCDATLSMKGEPGGNTLPRIRLPEKGTFTTACSFDWSAPIGSDVRLSRNASEKLPLRSCSGFLGVDFPVLCPDRAGGQALRTVGGIAVGTGCGPTFRCAWVANALRVLPGTVHDIAGIL